MTSKLSNYQLDVPEGYITHSITQFTATIADHSARAVLAGRGALANVNIPGIAGKMYTLIGVEIVNKSVYTTVVATGGLVEIFNDAIDWVPFEAHTNSVSGAGANLGAPQTPLWIPVNKPLPAGSNITVYYTSRNAATDWLSVTFFYSTRPYGNTPQTFIKTAYGTARTTVATFTSDGTIAIPANKGGNVVGFLAQCFGVTVTILNTGGNVAVHNTAANMAWEPTEFVIGSTSSIGTGGSELPVLKVDVKGDAPGNSSFTFDVTTISTNSQVYGYGVVWEA